MRITSLGSRSINHISYFPIPLEDEFYGNNDTFDKWDRITCSDRLSEQMYGKMKQLADD